MPGGANPRNFKKSSLKELGKLAKLSTARKMRQSGEFSHPRGGGLNQDAKSLVHTDDFLVQRGEPKTSLERLSHDFLSIWAIGIAVCAPVC